MPDFPTNGHDREPRTTANNCASNDSAALLLIESVIHGLIARSILTVKDAIDIIDIAADAERELYDSRGYPSRDFISVLTPLSRSLQSDLHA